MQTNSILALALGELGVLFSVFLGGRIVVESVVAIVLFAVSIAINVLPTGLTVFNNFEKNKSELELNGNRSKEIAGSAGTFAGKHWTHIWASI